MNVYTKVGDEQVIVAGDRILIASSSRPGIWYEVTADFCPCEAFTHGNGKPCKHIKATREARNVQPTMGVAVADPSIPMVQTTVRPIRRLPKTREAVITRMRTGSRIEVNFGAAILDGYPVPDDLMMELIGDGTLVPRIKGSMFETYHLAEGV